MRVLLLLVALIQSPSWAWSEAVELNIDETAPAASPAPTSAPTAIGTQAPTVVATQAPTVAPTVASTVEATMVLTPAKTDSLREVDFDKAGKKTDEDGMIIIAPGSQSPEESLESFGIDSPFDAKRKRGIKTLGAPKTEEGEAIELGSPERSDLKEKVALETTEGESLPGDIAYEVVERAGLVLGTQEYRVDGQVARERSGRMLGLRGTVIYLRMEPGRQVYPGTVYTLFRNQGLLRSGVNQADVGVLMIPSGVVRVIRVDGDLVAARVERSYLEIREGDLARLRDPDRLRHYNALRQVGSGAPRELSGEIIGVQGGRTIARKGDVVYLDLGRAKGNLPGLRLTVSRDVPPPVSPSQPANAQREGQRVGKIGQLEVLSTTRDACSAKVLKSNGELRLGDLVRLR